MSAKTTYQRYRLHSQLNSSVIKNYAKLSAREPMLINVNDAKAKGIATGDVVRAFKIGVKFSLRACRSSSQSTSSPSTRAHGMILKC